VCRVSEGDQAVTPGLNVQVPSEHDREPGEVGAHVEGGRFVWIDLEDPSEEALRRVAHRMSLHPLTVEQLRTFGQRPRFEDYDGYVSVVVFGVNSGTEAGGPLLREVHLIISGDAVVTVHRRPFDALADLRTRYPEERVRSEQFLVYTVLDAIISTFGPVLSRIDDEIDSLEQEIVARASAEDLQRIFSLRRDLVAMRRIVTPMRDMFQHNGDRIANLPGLQTDDPLYFRDLYDELVRTSELVDSYRDLLSGATDMYLSTIANRQGEINKQLTIIATIFLPLTFLTGFFGQNFSLLINHVLNHAWSFWVFGIGLLVASAIGFWIYLRRKRWL